MSREASESLDWAADSSPKALRVVWEILTALDETRSTQSKTGLQDWCACKGCKVGTSVARLCAAAFSKVQDSRMCECVCVVLVCRLN